MPHLSESDLANPPRVTLARTLGTGSIIFLGIGALLGGGIFTLLGPAAGLAGPGLFLAMILGSGIAFLNLQMYLALGTTFPEAGGGYLWVRKGLGDFQGFLAGWLSWFAHAAACGVYALSFGFYAFEIIKVSGINLGISLASAEKILGILVVLIFGYINWRGSKTTGSTGIYITVALLAILTLFIVSGFIKIGFSPEAATKFTPLLPSGILGILMAASFFYIAFEGSEIQVQAGEETKNPARTLKIGLFASWAIVSIIYVLFSWIIIGATPSDGGKIWEILGRFGEGAVVQSAKTFMPLGAFLMTVGGLLANLAALNATIFSSSHVSFALARDKNLWSRLSQIHFKNFTPHLAVIASTILVILMISILPLFDVASAASLLFILLFLQLNLAGIKIHFKFPETRWAYKVPLFPIVPIFAVGLYAILALTMFRLNPTAWLATIFWVLIGLVNYFAYAQTKSREQFKEEIVYEETVRMGPKRGKRILLPIAPDLGSEELKRLAELAFSLASSFSGEVIVAAINKIPPTISLADGARMTYDRRIIENIKKWEVEFNERMPGREKDINFHNLVLVGRDIVDSLLEIIKIEDCDLLILNWKGYTRTKGMIFGSKIDRVLREAKCDLLVVKGLRPIKSLMLAAHPNRSGPYSKAAGEIFSALKSHYHPRSELLSVFDANTETRAKHNPELFFKYLDLKADEFDEINFATGNSIIKTIIDEVKNKKIDAVIVGATQPRFLKRIRFGNISELLAKHLDAAIFIVKGHQGITEILWDKILNKFK